MSLAGARGWGQAGCCAATARPTPARRDCRRAPPVPEARPAVPWPPRVRRLHGRTDWHGRGGWGATGGTWSGLSLLRMARHEILPQRLPGRPVVIAIDHMAGGGGHGSRQHRQTVGEAVGAAVAEVDGQAAVAVNQPFPEQKFAVTALCFIRLPACRAAGVADRARGEAAAGV